MRYLIDCTHECLEVENATSSVLTSDEPHKWLLYNGDCGHLNMFFSWVRNVRRMCKMSMFFPHRPLRFYRAMTLRLPSVYDPNPWILRHKCRHPMVVSTSQTRAADLTCRRLRRHRDLRTKIRSRVCAPAFSVRETAHGCVDYKWRGRVCICGGIGS